MRILKNNCFLLNINFKVKKYFIQQFILLILFINLFPNFNLLNYPLFFFLKLFSFTKFEYLIVIIISFEFIFFKFLIEFPFFLILISIFAFLLIFLNFFLQFACEDSFNILIIKLIFILVDNHFQLMKLIIIQALNFPIIKFKN